MSIFSTLIQRGYLPKELPPSFSSTNFARYAVTRKGRAALLSYKPVDNFTSCVDYRLALPGSEKRLLRIPNPVHFAQLAVLVSKHLTRLLRKAGRSPFSKSRPRYSDTRYRAIEALTKPANLARERAAARAGARYLLRLDISQFYPSLYTHAIGWAVDPKLKDKANWKNAKLLGKRLDQALMNLQGKISQGIPVGNDVSFLLGEVVLAQVDRAVAWPADRSFRWYDDYEFSCDTFEQAERLLDRLATVLRDFNLRINWRKTSITQLPESAQAEWQHELQDEGQRDFSKPAEMVQFFDVAFRLHRRYSDSAVLLYALGTLFKVCLPTHQVGRVAQSGVTQALLCEPGCAQKAFSLLSYWNLNGFALDRLLICRTIESMILRHKGIGVSSDIAWALAFSLEQQLELKPAVAQVLSEVMDDCISIQSLHAHSVGLLPKGFSKTKMENKLKSEDLEGEHWLLVYEAARLKYSKVTAPIIAANPLFADLLAKDIGFYRTELPKYAAVVHPGGAPEWAVMQWLKTLQTSPFDEATDDLPPIVEAINRDIRHLRQRGQPLHALIEKLLAQFEPTFKTRLPGYEHYMS